MRGKWKGLTMATPAEQPAGPPPKRTGITVGANSRLEALLSRRGQAEAKLKEAADQLKAINDAIKNDALAAVPAGTEAVDIPAGNWWPALTVIWVRRHTLPAKELKAKYPEIFREFARDSSRWELRVRREDKQ